MTYEGRGEKDGIMVGVRTLATRRKKGGGEPNPGRLIGTTAGRPHSRKEKHFSAGCCVYEEGQGERDAGDWGGLDWQSGTSKGSKGAEQGLNRSPKIKIIREHG